MKRSVAVRVGVRELKNRLTSYLKLARANREVIVTERGRPIAVIHPVGSTGMPQSLEARIAALATRGEISAPEGTLASRVRRIRVGGRPLSEEIVAERR
jgi:prevent-host-death family protein